MSFHPAQVALIDDTNQISLSELATVAADLTTQANRDFGPVWNARANVTAWTEKTRPPYYWPIRIRTRLNQPGALGFHTDQNNQPVSYVELTNDWTVTVSHELCEMLADPSGNRLHAAQLPQGVQASQVGLSGTPLVRYLVEVADCPEAFSYVVGKTRCSDFINTTWYQSTIPAPSATSHTGALTLPRQIGEGGYCSFATPDDNWWQAFNQSGQLQVNNLGKFNASEARTLREWVDGKAREYRASR